MGGARISVVEAFTSIEGTENAGMVAYYRAPGCTEVTIADILPILSKINYYEDEYVIGEMLIWDTGEQSAEPNNCAMARVIVYNDGWICAWFDKTTQNQLSLSGAQYIDARTLDGWGSSLGYEDRWNQCVLKIIATDDPDMPVDTLLTIHDTDTANGRITIMFNDISPIFHSGYNYNTEIYMTNGNLIWWLSSGTTNPTTNSNRLYRGIYEVWEQIKNSSNSTNFLPTDASLIYMYDSQTDVYTDETTDFNDVGVDDCQVLPTDEAINDAFYIGSSNKFSGASITMGTPGVGSAITWEYFNGSIWSGLSVVDGSGGFTSTGELTFNPPDDWLETLVNSQSYFWIRARVTVASYTTTPLLTRGQLYLQENITYLDGELGVYNFEFTSANYLMMSGKYATTIHNYYYNTVLPSKVIYDSILCVGAFNTSSWSFAYFNGHYLYYGTYNNPSNGWIKFDTVDINYEPGTQNSIYLNTSPIPANARIHGASILITS